MGNEMGNTNSTSEFQEEEGNTKVVQAAQGMPVQQPVVSVNDQILDGALDCGNRGQGDHEEAESQQEVHDGLPTAESPPETNPQFDDETTRRPDGNLRSGGSTEEPEQLDSGLVELHEPFKQETLKSTPTAKSPNLEADETRSKDSELKLCIMPDELEQHNLDLVEDQESFKQEEANMLNPTSTVESLETNPESNETRSKEYSLQPGDLIKEAEELSSDLVEEQEPCKQASSYLSATEAEIPNPTTVTAVPTSLDEEHPNSYELVKSVLNQNEGSSTSTILSPPQNEEHPNSDESEPKMDHTSSIITESSSVDITGLENGRHLDDHTSHISEGVLVPENTMKEELLAKQPISPGAESSTEDDEPEPADVNGNNTQYQESESGSKIDSSIMPEYLYESNGSLNEPASEEQKTEVPQLGISITDGSNKEHDSEVIKQQREASEFENGSRVETEGKEECDPESPPRQEEKAPTKSEDSPQYSSSNSSWEFNPGNGHEFFADMAPTFVAGGLETVVPFQIQLPAEVPEKRSDANQQLGRLSTDLVPDNFSVNSKMQKSPSFNLHLRRRSTEDYSDQTPLLQQYQDKNTTIPPTKHTGTVESVKYEAAMPAGYKVIQTLEGRDPEKPLILGRGDSNGVPRDIGRAFKEESAALVPSKAKEQKHHSRRRPTIFGSCLCCTTTTAIN